MTNTKPKHDALFKRIMTNQIAAQEFLEQYLPDDLKQVLDLSKIKVEKESYIEQNLRQQFSDIIYAIQTKSNDTAYIYILLEHQSTVDHWMALRLWKYTLLLCERLKKNQDKLPLIYQMVIYNGMEVYTAPKNLWDLFVNPTKAKNLLTNNYKLIDLQSMSDDEITQKKHLGMFEYMLKNIHQRDMIKLWHDFLTRFKPELIIDKEQGYIYIKSFLWYTDAKLDEDKQLELEQTLTKHLSEEEKNNIMRTIAQKYIEEGEARGEARGKIEVAQKMLSQNYSITDISNLTGLSITKINELLKTR